MKALSDFLLTLYRGADRIPTGEFKNWALNEAKVLIPFDSCVWGIETDRQGIINHLHNCGFIPSWLLHQHEDKLSRDLRLNIGQTFNVNVATEYTGTGIYEFHYRRFAIEHILGTDTIDADTQLLNTMSLYRSDPNQPFTEVERALKEVIFPHLIEAVRKNWLVNLPHLFPGNQRSNLNSVATSDSGGILQIAMSSFIEICRLEWPEWTGPALPEAVRKVMQMDALKFIGRKIVISMSLQDDLLLLRARPKLAADDLTARELEVAQRFATGLNYKAIAQGLSVSPSTIRGHLTKIYSKLDINEKASLVAKIREMTH